MRGAITHAQLKALVLEGAALCLVCYPVLATSISPSVVANRIGGQIWRANHGTETDGLVVCSFETC